MADEILSSDHKTKLVVALPTIKFLNEDDCKPYRCMVCGDVAIYHYFATCEHLFCGKCHGIYVNKACPIDNCANKAIDEISQDKDFEMGVYNLKTYCTYKEYGCKEVVNLSGIMLHKHKCKFSTRNLLPRVWIPKLNAHEFDKQKEDLKDLKKAFATLRQERATCNCPNLENSFRNEIEQLQSTFEIYLKGIINKLQFDIAVSLGEKIEAKSQEMETKIREQVKKEIQDQKLNTDQTIESKVKDMEKRYEEHIDKIQTNCLNAYKECDEKLRFFEIQIERSMKEVQEKVTKEINAQKINVVSAVKSKLDDDIKTIENKMNKDAKDLKIDLDTKLTHHHKENTNAIQVLNDGFSKYKDDDFAVKRSLDEEIKILQNKITTSTEVLKLELDSKLTQHQKEYSTAIQALQNDISKNKNDDDFSNTNVQVLNKRIENITHYMIEEKSQDFTFKIDRMNEKLRDLKSGKEVGIFIGHFKFPGSLIEQTVVMTYESKPESVLIFPADISKEHLEQCKIFQIQVYSLCNSNNEIKECTWLNLDYNGECGGIIPIDFLENESPFVIDDSMQIIVRCIPYALLYKSFYSDNGISYWKLNNFKQLKQDALGGGFVHVWSDCFYSMEKGYRMQIGAAFNKTKASFFTIQRKGEYDALLDKELFHNITMTIFDQSDSEKKHLTKSAQIREIHKHVCDIGEFNYTQLENSRYLKNDCLLIKVIVKSVESNV